MRLVFVAVLAALLVGCGRADSTLEEGEVREGAEGQAPDGTRSAEAPGSGSDELSAYINAPVAGGIGNVVEKGPSNSRCSA